MSTENLEQFIDKVDDSEELQAKIGEEIDAEALIALGAECGYEFTAEEVQLCIIKCTDYNIGYDDFCNIKISYPGK